MHDSRHVVCRGLWSPHPKTRLRIKWLSKIINRGHQEGTIQKEYNFASDNLQLFYEDLEEQLRTIFKNEHQVFKIIFSMGFVLRNAEIVKPLYSNPFKYKN